MRNHPFIKELEKVHKKLDEIHAVLKGKPDEISKKKIINNIECMKLLSVSSGTLSNWRKHGKVPFRQIDNKIYYITDDLIKELGVLNKHIKPT